MDRTKGDSIERQYRQGKTITQIAEVYGVAPSTVWKELKRRGVPKRSFDDVKCGELFQLYIVENKTARDIANLYGYDEVTVRRRLTACGIYKIKHPPRV